MPHFARYTRPPLDTAQPRELLKLTGLPPLKYNSLRPFKKMRRVPRPQQNTTTRRAVEASMPLHRQSVRVWFTKRGAEYATTDIWGCCPCVFLLFSGRSVCRVTGTTLLRLRGIRVNSHYSHLVEVTRGPLSVNVHHTLSIISEYRWPAWA